MGDPHSQLIHEPDGKQHRGSHHALAERLTVMPGQAHLLFEAGGVKDVILEQLSNLRILQSMTRLLA